MIRSPSARSSTSRAELPQLGGQGGDAVGLLVPDVGHAGDRGRPVGEQGHGGERLHRVADGVHVDLDARAAAWPRHGDRVRRRRRTWQPICSRQSQKATSPWRLSPGEPLDGHLPPVIAAAAKK